jgi:hypothetical protein
VFEKGVLWEIFGPKRDEVTGNWRKLHKVEFHDLCSSPDVIRLIKLRTIQWDGNVARVGRIEINIVY